MGNRLSCFKSKPDDKKENTSQAAFNDIKLTTTDIAEDIKQQTEDRRIVSALYDFTSTTDGDLSFKKGDRMIILNDREDDWWHVEHVTRKQRGYIPCNYVTLENSLESYDLYADGLGRKLTKPCPSTTPELKDLSHSTKNNWDIPRNTLRLEEKLGAGKFGEVWKGTWNKVKTVAVKSFRPGSVSRQLFLSNAAIVKKFHHDKLVRLYAVCSLNEPIYMITELMPAGSLLTYLRDHGQSMTLTQLLDIATQVTRGMAYLEREDYIHGDLAARNVLVVENNIVKIADFGMGRLIQESDEYEEVSGFEIRWTAPEAVFMQIFTIKSDVWSFGILLIEMLTHGQTPYHGMTNREVLDQVERGYRLPKPKDCPDTLYEIMKRCWEREACKRYTFDYLVEFFYYSLPTNHST